MFVSTLHRQKKQQAGNAWLCLNVQFVSLDGRQRCFDLKVIIRTADTGRQIIVHSNREPCL